MARRGRAGALLRVAAAALGAAAVVTAQQAALPRNTAAARQSFTGRTSSLLPAPVVLPASSSTGCVRTAAELQAALDAPVGAAATELVVHVCLGTTIDLSASGPLLVTPAAGGGSVAKKAIYCSGVAGSTWAGGWDSTGSVGRAGATAAAGEPFSFFSQPCVLDGGGATRLMRVDNANVPFELELVGLRFTRGASSDGGAAIATPMQPAADTSARLRLVVRFGAFIAHHGGAGSGGALLVGPRTDLQAEVVDFFSNEAGAGGGAVLVASMALPGGGVVAGTYSATDNSFQQNKAPVGGAVLLQPSASLACSLCDFYQNAASSCGESVLLQQGTVASPTAFRVRFQGMPPVVNSPDCGSLTQQVAGSAGGDCMAAPLDNAGASSGMLHTCTVMP